MPVDKEQEHRHSLRRNTAFRHLFIGGAISTVGDLLFDVTALLWLTSRFPAGGTSIVVAGAVAAAATMLPSLVFGPIAGAVVDRLPRRACLLASNAIQGGCMVGLAVIAMVGGSWPATVPDICLVAGLLITNIASQVTTPARMVLTATIVPPASRDIASSVTISTLMTLSIVVPPLGAPLYVLAGQEAAMLLNAASFAVSSWCFLRVPEVCGTAAPEHLTAGLLRSMRAGLATATRIVMVRRLLLLVFFAALCLSGLNSQMVLLCREMLGWDSERLGVLFGLVAASSLVGSIAAPVLARTVGPRVMAAAALTGVGAGLIFSGVTTHTGMVLTGLATVGASSGAFNVAVGPVLMNHCPRDSLGRVSALLRPLDSLGSLISIGLTGVLLTTLGEHRIIIGGWEWGRMSVLLIASGVLFIGTTVVVGRQLDYSTHSDPS